MNAFHRLAAMVNKGDSAVLVTVISEKENMQNLVGKKILYDIKGNKIVDELPENLTQKITEHINSYLSEKATTKTITLKVDEVEYEIYMEKYIPVPKAIIFGAGHVSQPTSHLLKLIGFHVTVIDDRSSFANRERFPHADTIIVDSFESALNKIEVDANTWIILVTRGHRYDFLCLEKLIEKDFAYIGMMGSKTRAALTKKQLVDKGISREAVEKLYCPIGLDIGGKTPEELAVSIVSEIIAVKSGKPLGGVVN